MESVVLFFFPPLFLPCWPHVHAFLLKLVNLVDHPCSYVLILGSTNIVGSKVLHFHHVMFLHFHHVMFLNTSEFFSFFFPLLLWLDVLSPKFYLEYVTPNMSSKEIRVKTKLKFSLKQWVTMLTLSSDYIVGIIVVNKLHLHSPLMQNKSPKLHYLSVKLSNII
jgi:hypothetical protein